ncbi:MAG: DNA-directed RNA polymerase subunit omega [Candidatus Marinimicrobia bacterium]|nr:DNA-directed RNA polymerase subunit omega [Candidatus Neomarinimicrobiota bacterium]
MPISLDEFNKQSDDIYKLCLVAAKRAKQINKLRIAKYPMPDAREEQEETIYVDEEEVNWDEMEKPTTIALKEVMNGKAEYELRNSEE